MKKNSLLNWLNWFYTLEVSQVHLYLNQARSSKNNSKNYIARVLLKTAEIEAEHAINFDKIFKKLNTKPARINSLFSYLTGFIPGKFTPGLGTENFFYYNYTLETIAMDHYQKFINKLEPDNQLHSELLELLVNNLIEEDLHRLWFKGMRQKLKN